MRSRLLHRIVLGEQVSFCALILSSLLSLALVIKLLQFNERFFSQEMTLLDLAQLLFFLSPFFLFLLIPLACMLSIFLVMLRMNTDKELLALKAGGVSLYQILPMPITLCLLCTTFHLWVSLYGLGWGMEHFYKSAFALAKKKSQMMVQAGVFNNDIKGMTLFAQKVDVQTGEMRHIFIQDRTRKDAVATITAEQGVTRHDSDKFEMVIALHKGRILRQDKDQLSILDFQDYILRMELQSMVGLGEKNLDKPTEMNWSQLIDRTPNRRKEPQRFEQFRAEKSKRLLLPLASLLLGLAALPLAFVFQGLQRQYGVVLAIGLFFGYYGLFSLGSSLSSTGTVSPLLALWVPHALFLMAVMWAVSLAAREKTPALPQWVRRLIIGKGL